MPLRRFTAVGPRPRQRHLPADPAGADKHSLPAPSLDVENLQSLPDQRVERMGDDNKTQTITGRGGSIPPPSRPCGTGWSKHP
jgi:hypothetical protein